jgi:hypothetical protein
LDEPTCFGLSSGLGFTFVTTDQPNDRYLLGQSVGAEQAFCENLGISYSHTEGADWDRTWKGLKRGLNGGDPGIVFVDRSRLDYATDTDSPVPESLLIIGYDETVPVREVSHAGQDADPGVVYCADPRLDEVKRLSLYSLQRAMASQTHGHRPNRYLFVESDPTINQSEAARRATRQTAQSMLDPSTMARPVTEWGAHGLPGIKTFASDIAEWTALDTPHRTIQAAYHRIDGTNTPGAANRTLYTAYLDAIESDIGLSGFADEMYDIEQAWHRIADLLSEAGETEEIFDLPGYLSKSSNLISALAEQENEFYTEVLKTLNMA